MSRMSWIEVQCDYCGTADHYPTGTSDTIIRRAGWIITKDGKHYCDKDCHREGTEKETVAQS